MDADRIRVLHTRAAALGPAMHYLLEVEWPELYGRAEPPVLLELLPVIRRSTALSPAWMS